MTLAADINAGFIRPASTHEFQRTYKLNGRVNVMFRYALSSCCAVLVSTLLTAAEPSAKSLLNLHLNDAADYAIARSSAGNDLLELQREPIFTWTNPSDYGFQTGHIFVWTHRGRPEAIGTFFSVKAENKTRRMLVHEFHTLSESRLYPKTPSYSEEKWEPQIGIEFTKIEGTATTESTNNSNNRLRTMKSIARTLTAQTVDTGANLRELRLLTTPLLRYEPKDGDVVDGALFAMVSSDGTDPEVLLMVEMTESSVGNPADWRVSALRFSDKDIQVQKDGKELWSSLKDASKKCAIEKSYRLLFTPQRDYMCYRSHEIEELPEAATVP